LDVPVAIHTSDLLYFLNGTQAPIHPTNALAAMIKVIGKNMQVKKRYGIKAEIVFDEELKLHEYGVDALAVATPVIPWDPLPSYYGWFGRGWRSVGGAGIFCLDRHVSRHFSMMGKSMLRVCENYMIWESRNFIRAWQSP
jgi:hypothetical protein